MIFLKWPKLAFCEVPLDENIRDVSKSRQWTRTLPFCILKTSFVLCPVTCLQRRGVRISVLGRNVLKPSGLTL